MSGKARLSFWLIAGLLCPLWSSAQTLISRNSRYLLRPGDQVTIEYRYTPEYNATVSIQPDGFSTLPLVGDVKLGGLTLPQVHDLLVVDAGKRLNDPELTVGLKEFEKPYYIVGGEVGTPGRYDIHGEMTALRAIEIAGGFKPTAKSSQVLLLRPVSGDRAETRLIDLKKVVRLHQPVEDVQLREGDMLIVPKSRIAKIEPYVRLFNTGFYLSPTTF